jgi:hypothetical protein
MAAAAAVGSQPSSAKNNDNARDRQKAPPRPNNNTFIPSAEGLTIISGTLPTLPAQPGVLPPAPLAAPSAPLSAAADPSAPQGLPNPFAGAPGLPPILLNVSGAARGDVVFDSTAIGSRGEFVPSTIPARTDAFFGGRERATVLAAPSVNHLAFNALANTGLDMGNGPETAKVYADLQLVNLADGTTTVRARHLYGQFLNIIVGQTNSMFSDPDAAPDTLDVAGPNAQMDTIDGSGAQVVGYFIPFSVDSTHSFYAAISAEKPQARALDPNLPMTNSYSHIPDFVARVRVQDNVWGHVQLATLLRSVDIEDAMGTYRRDVFGWGIHGSGTVYPFTQNDCLKNDHFSFGVAYGQGIGSYNTDLNLGMVQGSDAVVDAAGSLRALNFSSYFVGYSRYWTNKVTSTVTYGQVNLGSLCSEDPSSYRHGRYASANVVYHWAINLPGDTTDAASSGHSAFVGAEILYGEKETLGNGTGHDYRTIITAGVKY